MRRLFLTADGGRVESPSCDGCTVRACDEPDPPPGLVEPEPEPLYSDGMPLTFPPIGVIQTPIGPVTKHAPPTGRTARDAGIAPHAPEPRSFQDREEGRAPLPPELFPDAPDPK